MNLMDNIAVLIRREIVKVSDEQHRCMWNDHRAYWQIIGMIKTLELVDPHASQMQLYADQVLSLVTIRDN